MSSERARLLYIPFYDPPAASVVEFDQAPAVRAESSF